MAIFTSLSVTFLTSNILSCNGNENIVAGSSVVAKSNVKLGPKHAVATRPWGTVHLSACHGVGTPVFQTLTLNINFFNYICNYLNIEQIIKYVEKK